LILVDANLLIYAVNAAAPQHVAARSWLDARMNSSVRVGLPWPSLLAFNLLVCVTSLSVTGSE
jgi:predicted nucleic acid-binding protein